MKTGIEILKDPYTTAGEIADILANGHPPFCTGEVQCCKVSCRECWLAWLTTGEPPKPKEVRSCENCTRVCFTPDGKDHVAKKVNCPDWKPQKGFEHL